MMVEAYATFAHATLITGATGMLGQEVLVRLLTGAGQVIVVARGERGKPARRRIETIVRRHLPAAAVCGALARLIVLEGDVCAPNFGLDADVFDATAASVSRIIHCAAAVRFDQPLDEARRSNLDGTRHALDLARRAVLSNPDFQRFDYVGTAYICGVTRGIVYEYEIGRSKRFHNTYEQSKLEAERLVRAAMTDVPITIYRPSIIIGNSQTGETGNFKAFYWPLRVYAMGQLPVLPGVANCKIDLVPVDYVAAALLHIGAQPQSVGGCYHLTAGRDNVVTLRQIFDAAVAFWGVRPPRLIHPRWLRLLDTGLGRRLFPPSAHKTLKLGTPYFPYLALNMQFDTANTQAALRDSTIRPVNISRYFDRLFRYCTETDWGHRAPASDAETNRSTTTLVVVGVEE